MDVGTWPAMVQRGHKESNTTEAAEDAHTHTHTHTHLEYIKGIQNSVIKQPNKEWAKVLNIEETVQQRKICKWKFSKERKLHLINHKSNGYINRNQMPVRFTKIKT